MSRRAYHTPATSVTPSKEPLLSLPLHDNTLFGLSDDHDQRLRNFSSGNNDVYTTNLEGFQGCSLGNDSSRQKHPYWMLDTLYLNNMSLSFFVRQRKPSGRRHGWNWCLFNADDDSSPISVRDGIILPVDGSWTYAWDFFGLHLIPAIDNEVAFYTLTCDDSQSLLYKNGALISSTAMSGSRTYDSLGFRWKENEDGKAGFDCRNSSLSIFRQLKLYNYPLSESDVNVLYGVETAYLNEACPDYRCERPEDSPTIPNETSPSINPEDRFVIAAPNSSGIV